MHKYVKRHTGHVGTSNAVLWIIGANSWQDISMRPKYHYVYFGSEFIVDRTVLN